MRFVKSVFFCFEDIETQPLLYSQFVELAHHVNAESVVTLKSTKELSFWKKIKQFHKNIITYHSTEALTYSRGYLSTFLLLLHFKRVEYFDPRGLLPIEYIARKKKIAGLFLFICFSLVECINIALSKNTLCVSFEMQSYFQSKLRYYFFKKKFIVAYPFSKKTIKRENIPRKVSKKVCYVGSTEVWQRIEDVMRSIFDLSRLNPDYDFFFVTKNSLHTKELYHRNYPYNPKIHFLSLEPKDVDEFLNDIAFGIILRDNTLLNKVSSPIKVGEYLRNGVFVLYDGKIGDYNNLLARFDIGKNIHSFQFNSYKYDRDKFIEFAHYLENHTPRIESLFINE